MQDYVSIAAEYRVGHKDAYSLHRPQGINASCPNEGSVEIITIYVLQITIHYLFTTGHSALQNAIPLSLLGGQLRVY